MDALDYALRDVVERASAAPISRRSELLDLLVDRVDAGGVDVAHAPEPAPMMAAVEGAMSTRRSATPRTVVRIAGVGIAGWALFAAGTLAAAAAAAGAWLILDPRPAPGPSQNVEVPAGPITRAESTPHKSDEPSPQPSASGVPATVKSQESPLPPQPAGPAAMPPTSPVTIPGVVAGVTGAVEDVLPAGPVADTIAPVIHAIDVSGLTAWALDTLVCGNVAPTSVTVSDNTGVTSVSVRVSTITGFNVTVALTDAGGGTWTGGLAPLSVLNLGLLNNVAHVSVEARDAAGNVATAAEDVTVQIGSC